MHYKNGIEAHAGDHVVTKDYNGNVVGGVIHSLRAPDSTCNCDITVIIPGGTQQLTCQNVANMWLASDMLKTQEVLSAS